MSNGIPTLRGMSLSGLTPGGKFLSLLQGQPVSTPRPAARTARGNVVPVLPGTPPYARPATKPAMPLEQAVMAQSMAQPKTSAPMTKLQRDLAMKMGLTGATQQQKDSAGGIMGMLPGIDTPGGAGLSAAAARGLQLSGYQDRPITTGQVLGEMMGAGMEAYRAAQAGELESRLTEAKIAESEAKSGRIFTGTSFTAQSYQNLIDLGQKIKDGTASLAEQQAYGLIYQKLSMPETETRQTDAGVVTVKRPAMNLSAFPTPPGFEPQGERVVGEQSAKFTDGQANAAGFAERMRLSIDTFDTLTQGGYQPANLTDQIGEAAGLNIMVSPEGQQYNRAKRDFITAVLRRESGAAIAQSEFVTEEKKYFPQPFDNAEVIADKAKSRKTALESMIAQSGPAYDVLFPGPEISLPEGSKLIKETAGKKYYETQGGDILVVDK